MDIKVMVADDHEVVRTGVKSLLEGTAIQVIAEASHGKEAARAFEKHKADVALVDIRMPDFDGLDAITRIRKKRPDAKIVMLSTYDNPTYIARSLTLGASDYVLKGSSKKALVSAITRAAGGEDPLSSSPMAAVKSTMQDMPEGQPEDTKLTRRELQVLKHLALGLSNRDIAISLEISVETVKEHVQNVIRKVEAVDRTQAAVWAIKNGVVNGIYNQ